MKFHPLIKNLSRYMLLIYFSVLLISCSSSSQFQYISQEYKSRNETTVKVMVMPFILKLLDIQQKELLIDKKNREKKPITNREVELFDNYMTQLIADNTRAKISSASNLPNLEDFKFSKQIVKNKTVDNFEIFIPSFDKKIFKSEVPDYLALFTDLFILKYNDDKGLSVGRGSETSYSLEAGLEYVLWDVKNMRVASYGRLNQKIKLLDTPAKEDYLAIFEKFAISIIQQSPFATKKIYF